MHKSEQLKQVEKITNFALFISISIVLSIFEMLFPINFAIPGLKLGLGNILLVILLDYYTFSELFVFQLIKISITTFILGLFSTFLFSICGGIFALIIMFTLHRLVKKISIYTLSMAGAIAHNIGQITFAMFALNAFELINYIPFLVIFGSITGFVLALIIEKIKIPLIRGENAISI